MENEKKILKYKIVILGDSNVGKSSIILKLTTGNFYEKLESTIGVNNFKYLIETTYGQVELNLWDTAGQEVFHSLVPLYSRSASICLLVCSTDLNNSIENIGKWIKTIEESCDPMPPIILALNKIDLIDEHHQIIQNIIKDYNKQIIDFFSISAKTGQNISELFLSIALKAINPIENNFQKISNNKSFNCC